MVSSVGDSVVSTIGNSAVVSSVGDSVVSSIGGDSVVESAMNHHMKVTAPRGHQLLAIT